MNRYHISVHLSNDFRRTCAFRVFYPSGDSFEKAARDGCYDEAGFSWMVLANSHLEAAEIAFAVCNSYPDELHCDRIYEGIVRSYRKADNRSLSVGDLLMIRNYDSPNAEDGRYGCASLGFERF